MAHAARGPAVPRTAVSLHKHSTGHGRPSTPGSGLPAHAPQRCRGPRQPAPGEAYAAGSSGSRTNGQEGTPVCAAARGPVCAAADTAPRLDSPRELLGCQAMLCPPGGGTRTRTDAAPVPPPPPPRGRTRKAPAPLRSARAAASSPPSIPPWGTLRLAALLEGGQWVFYWPGCVLRPLQASPPAKPQDACLLLAGRARSTTLAALTQHCRLLRRCASSFQGSAM